jgi:hypothetical protein
MPGRAQALFIALTLMGCAGEDPVPQHVEWVRVDGKPLTSQFNRDSTACRSETQKATNRAGDVGPSEKKAKAVDDAFARCMANRGYVELRQDIR